jgi:hypothetical protein
MANVCWWFFFSKVIELLDTVSKKPKGQLEAVNRIMTENTMAKRKRTNNDLQTTTQETKD